MSAWMKQYTIKEKIKSEAVSLREEMQYLGIFLQVDLHGNKLEHHRILHKESI
jgi:hypothetical protein